ncbi:MAG: MBOAT family protein [Leptospiraceae bacterium]|nr:MBOAT family protein [Leptospiraceae bacterium]MCP5501145.1 MBOAT family protein [Leptospiraceae bacterium]
MLFNSFIFLIFFIVLYLLYHTLHERYKKSILLIGSIIFYGAWDYLNFETLIPRFLLLFLFTIYINFLCLKGMENTESRTKKKLFLSLAVIYDVSNLMFFKYFYFFAGVLGHIIGIEDLEKVTRDKFHIILPIGISFYTFQIIAYLVDYYRGQIKEKTTLTDFSLFILFFPQQIAGPILRSTEFMPALRTGLQFTEERVVPGLGLVGLGLIKKVLLADSIAEIINPIYASPGSYHGMAIVAATIGFSIQIWGDFSGYSDIARGLGHLLGFDLPKNFTGPYFSTGFAEVWVRWHITLSRFLRDYLYIPLGGNRVSPWRSYLNSVLTMLIAGFWHGANWTFVIWGGLWGVMIALERSVLDRFSWWKETGGILSIIIKMFIVHSFWLICAPIFRISKISDYSDMLYNVFHTGSSPKVNFETLSYLFLLFLILHYIEYKPEVLEKIKRPLPYILVGAFILFFALTSFASRSVKFYYFQF